MMNRRAFKTSSKMSLQKKPSAAKSQGSQQSAQATRTKNVKSVSTKEKTFDLPAFSIPLAIDKTVAELEKLRKKTIRRNAPPGEDIRQIKQILKSLKQQPITVQEFVGLIGPSTGDGGETLRVVMNDDLNAFRSLARQVYETNTQDNSDVIRNEQLQLTEYYKEKKNYYHFKMMAALKDTFAIVPNFNFDRYGIEKEKYLVELFPIPQKVIIDQEKIEMLKRQAAYHRLKWLYSEGERLAEENNSLKHRFKQLKQLHLQSQKQKAEMEEAAEEKRQTLEAEETKKEQKLEELDQSFEKFLVQQEILLIKDDEKKKYEDTKKKGAVRKTVSRSYAKKKASKPPWHELAARKIEEQQFEERQQSERERITSYPAGRKVRARENTGRDEMSPKEHHGRRSASAPQDQWTGFY